MDINKLTRGDRIVVGSGIAFLIFTLLPWYGKGSYSRNGWHYPFWGWVSLIIVIVMVAQILVHRFTDTKMPELPLTWGQGHLILGGLVTLIVLIKLIIGDKYSFFGVGSVDLDRKFGLFLAFIAAIGLTVGAYFKMQEGDDLRAAGPRPASPPPGPPAGSPPPTA